MTSDCHLEPLTQPLIRRCMAESYRLHRLRLRVWSQPPNFDWLGRFGGSQAVSSAFGDQWSLGFGVVMEGSVSIGTGATVSYQFFPFGILGDQEGLKVGCTHLKGQVWRYGRAEIGFCDDFGHGLAQCF